MNGVHMQLKLPRLLRRMSYAVICLSCTVFAAAQRQGGPQRPVLQALDTDHDGKLSAAEIKAAPQTLLVLDRNGDGQLTPDELEARPDNAGASAEELVKQLMAFDRNGDGVLTPEELPERMQNLFQRADINHDGKLTPEEIRALASRQSMPAGPSSQGNDRNMRADPILNALDTNHDGVISTAEIAAADKSLLALDLNHDGEISADEMRVRPPSPQQQVEHVLGEFDTNKDGRLSKAEAPDRLQQQFESIDTNHDGFLDKQELLVYFNVAGTGRQRDSEHHDGGPTDSGSPKQEKQ